MLLSGDEIREEVESNRLGIEPLTPDNIQPASIDLTLHSILRINRDEPVRGIALDPELLDVSDHIMRYTDEVDLSTGRWRFTPGKFVIGMTHEAVSLPLDLAGRVEGRSRLARLGVGVHITAPKIDPGFNNRITLEMFNLGPWTIELASGMRICTLLVERLSKPARWLAIKVYSKDGSRGAL